MEATLSQVSYAYVATVFYYCEVMRVHPGHVDDFKVALKIQVLFLHEITSNLRVDVNIVVFASPVPMSFSVLLV